jgi:hypothetical protein
MFVSCKDYDDDINNVSDRVTVLEAAKVDLENKIATLRADLEANYATKVALADTAHKERARALAAEAALSTRITTAQDAIDDLDALIGGNLEGNFAGMTYKQALATTWAKIESVESGLGNRITKLETDLNLDNADSKLRVYLKNLENQIAALEAWQAALNADGGAATKNYVGTEIAAAEARAAIDAATKAAQAQAAAEATAKAYTDAELAAKIADALQKAAADAQQKADAAKAAAIAAAATDATNKANAAEAAAKQYAAQEAQAKADAAEAAAKAYAKSYADQVKVDAAVDATTKANAAEAAAKAYADQLLVQAKAYADDKAATAESNAKAYADAQIATAKAEAIAEAARLDAIVLDKAKAYTNTEIQNLKDNELKALSDRIDALNDRLNVLDMISKQLRSLVFIPQGYIDGVEGLKVLYLYYWKFNNHYNANGSKDNNENWTKLNGANAGWNTKEAKYNETLNITLTGKDREQDHDRYYSQNYKVHERLLDFTAKYHINPTSADISLIKSVGTVNADKWFEKTRTADRADAGFFIRDWKADNGILYVDYGMTDRTKIKTGNEITVFATTVQYGDTTITSDYATLMNIFVDSLVLSHAPKSVAPSLRVANPGATVTKDTKALVRNTHCGYCALADATNGLGRDSLHLFATITEAAGSGADHKVDDKFAPQDSVAYNNRDGINLAQLVETHYTDKVDHKHKHLTNPSEYGLHYEFELTKLIYGDNLTSESAHAVIVFKKDGEVVEEGTEGATPYLIPWMPTQNDSREGVQSAYDATKAAQYQTKQLVGRTPLVRVSLVDENGNVLDYGYIRFLITDNDVEEEDPENPYRRFISFQGSAWAANKPWCGTWSNSKYGYETVWIETELQLYALDGTMSHSTFLNNYQIEYKSGSTTALKQYNVGAINPEDANQAKFTAATYDRGIITENPNLNPGESNTLKWDMTVAQAKDAWIDGKINNPATPKVASDAVAVRYIYDPNKDGVSDNVLKDIYVVFKTGALTYTEGTEVVGTINWGDRKNPNYWYAKSSNVERSGKVEIHANVYGVEDEKENQAETLAQTIQATFMGNQIVDLTKAADKNAFITTAVKNDATATPSVLGKDLTLDLQFVTGEYKLFKGWYTNGKIEQIVTQVADKKSGEKGHALLAFVDYDKDGAKDVDEPIDTVATLEYTDAGSKDINHMDVKFHKTAIAEALLNYRSSQPFGLTGHETLEGFQAWGADVLTAYVNVKAKYGTCDVVLSGDPINVRFLRPINAFSKDAEVEDASVNGKQIINLLDLVDFTDWRNEPFKTNYWNYYDVKSITIPGVANNGNISINTSVMTNLGIETADAKLTNKLSDVSNLVEFIYKAPAVNPVVNVPGVKPNADAYGTLVYTNLGSTVQKFAVKIPLKITYIWGELYTEATINVKKTKENARRY